MQLSKQTIRARCLDTDCPMITPFQPDKMVVNGKSAGLSSASYDCSIDHDLTLGVNPAFILVEHILEYGLWPWHWGKLRRRLKDNPPMYSLAYTVEDFCMPPDVSGAVCDKSSYARVFVSAFNTFFDPGFKGNATLELVNHSNRLVFYRRGDPVVQFIFSMLDEPTEAAYDGKYQNQTKAAHPARYEASNDEGHTNVGRAAPAFPVRKRSRRN